MNNETENIALEKAILIGLITQQQNERKAIEYINELEFLADTAGATVVHKFFQRLDYANSKTFVGSGKLEEIKQYIADHEVNLAIFDDELSPSQLRNIEKELQVKVNSQMRSLLNG